MKNPISKLRLTLEKTLMAVSGTLFSLIYVLLLLQDIVAVWYAIITLVLALLSLASVKVEAFVKKMVAIKEKYETDRDMRKEEMETIKALRPSSDQINTAMASFYSKDKSDAQVLNAIETEIIKTNDPLTPEELIHMRHEMQKIALQLSQSKVVIETQNRMIKEYEDEEKEDFLSDK